MLKGTTRIELTDVHSGEKQIIEKHNMVTNALQELFSPVGMCKTASTSQTAIKHPTAMNGTERCSASFPNRARW